MTDPLTIRIPKTPDRHLSPNVMMNGRARHFYKAKARKAASDATVSTMNGRTWGTSAYLRVVVDIYWQKGAKTKDWDNCIASLKAYFDGVFENLDADDRQVRAIELHQHRDPAGVGFMVLTLEEM